MDSHKTDPIDMALNEDERPASLLGDQDSYRRLEKLGQRVTIITILIPVLVALIGYLVYRDIRILVSQTQDLSAKELTAIARNLESNLSNLSINHAKLQEEFHAKIDQLQTEAVQLKERIEQQSMRIDEVRALKLDKTELSTEIAKLDTRLATAQKETKAGIDKLTSDQKALEKKYADDMGKISEHLNGITTAVAECQADLGLISGEKADKRQLEALLKGYEKRLQEIADRMTQSVDAQLNAVKTSIRELEKAKPSAESPAAAPAHSAPGAKKPPAPGNKAN
jgi:chromosome segregation ATPase